MKFLLRRENFKYFYIEVNPQIVSKLSLKRLPLRRNKMADIYVSYKVETDVQGIVRPGDELKGKVFIRSEEKKEQKIKFVGAHVTEHCTDKVYNQTFKEYRDEDVGKLLKNVDIYKGGDKIGSGETKEYDFVIKLPTFPGKRKRDWYVSIDFVQKTG